MKAKELMIGDWVLGKHKKPLKVENINDNDKCINEVYCQGDIVDEINETDIEPIPLTEEILKANEHKWIGISKFGFPNIVIDTPKCYILKDFSYVHELQHALRLCGLNELADNFKMEI